MNCYLQSNVSRGKLRVQDLSNFSRFNSSNASADSKLKTKQVYFISLNKMQEIKKPNLKHQHQNLILSLQNSKIFHLNSNQTSLTNFKPQKALNLSPRSPTNMSTDSPKTIRFYKTSILKDIKQAKEDHKNCTHTVRIPKEGRIPPMQRSL